MNENPSQPVQDAPAPGEKNGFDLTRLLLPGSIVLALCLLLCIWLCIDIFIWPLGTRQRILMCLLLFALLLLLGLGACLWRGIYLPLLTALRELGPDADGRMPQGSPVPAITCRIRRMHENMQRTRLALEESHENLRQNLRQTEKMALVGKLAAGVAHSIRNPLTGLKLRLFSFTRGMELSPAQQEDVQAMNEAVRHMEAITSNFLEFSRRPRLSKEPLDMSEVLDRTLILLQPRMEAYKVTLRRTRHAPLPGWTAMPNSCARPWPTSSSMPAKPPVPTGKCASAKSAAAWPRWGPWWSSASRTAAPACPKSCTRSSSSPS